MGWLTRKLYVDINNGLNLNNPITNRSEDLCLYFYQFYSLPRRVISEVYASFFCSVLSLGGNVNTSLMSKPDMGSIFHIKNQWNILVTGNYYVNYQNYQSLMLLTSSDTRQTLMHLFLFTNSTQRELLSICTQSLRNCN